MHATTRQFMSPALWHALLGQHGPRALSLIVLRMEGEALVIQHPGAPDQRLAHAHHPLVQVCALWAIMPEQGTAQVWTRDIGGPRLFARTYPAFLRQSTSTDFERLDIPAAHTTFLSATRSAASPSRWKGPGLACHIPHNISAHAALQRAQTLEVLRGLSRVPDTVAHEVMKRAGRLTAPPPRPNLCSEITP